jgi:hypothetical protein
MIRRFIPSLLFLPVAASISAQAPAIPRPDTLGANFDHSTPGRGTPADYDFLVGKWMFRYQQRDPVSGSYGPVLTGQWIGDKTHETLFADQFLLVNRAGVTHVTATYRVLNPQRGLWEIQGVAVRRGVWQPGISWSNGVDRFLVQHNPETSTTLRIRYYGISHGRFQWRADGSRDGGRSWLSDVILIEATRVQ